MTDIYARALALLDKFEKSALARRAVQLPEGGERRAARISGGEIMQPMTCSPLRIRMLEEKLDATEGMLATCTDLANSWAREAGVSEASTEEGLRNLLDRLWASTTASFFGRCSNYEDALREGREKLAEAERKARAFDWLMANRSRHVSRVPDGWLAFFHSSPVGELSKSPLEAIESAIAEEGK